MTLNDGATFEVASGRLIGGPVYFGAHSGGSTMILDASTSFQALVASFGAYASGFGFSVKPDQVDLKDNHLRRRGRSPGGTSVTAMRSQPV